MPGRADAWPPGRVGPPVRRAGPGGRCPGPADPPHRCRRSTRTRRMSSLSSATSSTTSNSSPESTTA
ncbi:hypothetical protein DN051_39435 [Streptomyces cadmiisoli]|uniref:Uncharacterized protein n=1 Tax=Streptomyces cadmiisoli TaxID=2184053 RepID=A0A2Z4JAJ0_9ACTN|nr:hypothetical protein DN051_39435 [Streptomyces cadmiisoli]